MRVVKTHPLLSAGYHAVGYYPVPSNITYFWNFGFLAGVCLVVQILTGVALAMHYTANVDLAFISVEHIMRDVNYGWLLRYVHANGASMFFIVVYTHMLRGLYFGSYMQPRQALWASGGVIFALMMATGFIGYVLPWGQMSFWGATVITNLASAIPYVGTDIVYWLWGGFSVDNPTLNKFFSAHYLLPFVLVGVMLIHLVFLHEVGSNNPLGVRSFHDQIPFTPYSTFKDLYSLIVFFIFFGAFVFFSPNYLGHTDNYIPGNPMVTPAHIVPEWYFLPYYAILRSVPDKLAGVVLMAASLVVVILLPFYVSSDIRSSAFRPLYRLAFWFFVVDVVILAWVGGNPVKSPYYELGQVATFVYFAYLLLFLPFISRLETYLWSSTFESKGASKPKLTPLVAMVPLGSFPPRGSPWEAFNRLIEQVANTPTYLLMLAVGIPVGGFLAYCVYRFFLGGPDGSPPIPQLPSERVLAELQQYNSPLPKSALKGLLKVQHMPEHLYSELLKHSAVWRLPKALYNYYLTILHSADLVHHQLHVVKVPSSLVYAPRGSFGHLVSLLQKGGLSQEQATKTAAELVDLRYLFETDVVRYMDSMLSHYAQNYVEGLFPARFVGNIFSIALSSPYEPFVLTLTQLYGLSAAFSILTLLLFAFFVRRVLLPRLRRRFSFRK
jgi:ubiquinol-cytochrome c reductase cytochrome b/c1 subunit